MVNSLDIKLSFLVLIERFSYFSSIRILFLRFVDGHVFVHFREKKLEDKMHNLLASGQKRKGFLANNSLPSSICGLQ